MRIANFLPKISAKGKERGKNRKNFFRAIFFYHVVLSFLRASGFFTEPTVSNLSFFIPSYHNIPAYVFSDAPLPLQHNNETIFFNNYKDAIAVSAFPNLA
jgi:hypothetical protein